MQGLGDATEAKTSSGLSAMTEEEATKLPISCCSENDSLTDFSGDNGASGGIAKAQLERLFEMPPQLIPASRGTRKLLRRLLDANGMFGPGDATLDAESPGISSKLFNGSSKGLSS